MRTKSKHPTLSEVAQKAGVGTTTVSRVINGGQSVDPKTLARVQRAIEALGYMPNQAARILKGDRTRSIGFVIPSIADPFFASCAEAAQAISRANDSLLIVLTTQNDPHAELESVNVLMRHRVDGFIIAPSNKEDPALVKLLRRSPVPVVALDRPVSELNLTAVVADNHAGAQLATKHLIEHGYKRIVCITGETGLYTIRERVRGYEEAMTAAGLTPIVDTSVHDHASAEEALLRMLKGPEPPEALFTLKNSNTIDLFEALQKHAIPIPGRIALVGYDDFLLAQTVRPSITVVQQPIDQLGHRAAELLFDKMLGRETAGTKGGAVQLKTRLILRASCGCEAGHQNRAR